jgi:hypothetical protein
MAVTAPKAGKMPLGIGVSTRLGIKITPKLNARFGYIPASTASLNVSSDMKSSSPAQQEPSLPSVRKTNGLDPPAPVHSFPHGTWPS